MIQIIRLAIFVCVLITAGIHLYLGITANLPMFYANALGYVVLGSAYVMITPIPRSRVSLVLLLYTLATIGLWVAFGAHTPIAYINKIIELLIVGLLWYARQHD